MKRLCLQKYSLRLIVLILVVGFVTTCSMDHGISPLPGKLRVRVIFRGDPPSDTQGVYLVVAPQFPPHAINELYQSPNSLPVDQDTVVTELDLPYGHYDSYALWWYSKDSKSNLADILSLPLDPFNQLMPLGFDLDASEPIVERTLRANWSRVQRDATIKGTITFNGPFPDNTLATAIAAFQFEPKENIHFLAWLKSIDFSIDTNPYRFSLPVRSGETGFIAVYWLPEHASLTEFKTVGIYEDPNTPGHPGQFSLAPGEIVTGADISVDWSRMETP